MAARPRETPLINGQSTPRTSTHATSISPPNRDLPPSPIPAPHTHGGEDRNIDPANRKCSDRIRYSTNSDPRPPPTPTRARHTSPPARFASSAPAARVLRSPLPSTRPTLSCDGGRPSHGRATLLLSGRPEAYDKFRWRAGSGRGSLAAVLCVVGPQGRQIALRLAHALPLPPTIPDRSRWAHFLSRPLLGYPGASLAGASRRGVSRSCVCVTAMTNKLPTRYIAESR